MENIYWVLEDGARRPPSYYSLQGHSLPSIRGGGSRVSGAGEGLLLEDGARRPEGTEKVLSNIF